MILPPGPGGGVGIYPHPNPLPQGEGASSPAGRDSERGARRTKQVVSQQYYYGTGRRKSSVARVRLYVERGPIVVNGKPMEETYGWKSWQDIINSPLEATDTLGQVRVVAKVSGGGVVSQSGALKHGISRALLEMDPSLRATLKRGGFLTRDAREKERKKYGLQRARKKEQFSKR